MTRKPHVPVERSKADQQQQVLILGSTIKLWTWLGHKISVRADMTCLSQSVRSLWITRQLGSVAARNLQVLQVIALDANES